MSKRRRWRPIKGTASRIYQPWERALVSCLDLPSRLLSLCAGRGSRTAGVACPNRLAVKRVLVLRLDRIGDVLMSLPALADLRAALPNAHISLAVGAWSADIARSAPIDELLVWSAPWIGRADDGALRVRSLASRAWSLRRHRPDLAIDLQGDLRAAILMFLARAKIRVGYANTGGVQFLTDIVALDETISWVEQNRLAVQRAVGFVPEQAPPAILEQHELDFAKRLRSYLGLTEKRPLVGIHPSGGRAIKQWDTSRWNDLARRLQREHHATIIITGSVQDEPLARMVGQGLSSPAVNLAGRLAVRETLAVIAELDLFLSSDTGPMHMACAVGTPSVSLFGPSDPARYFSGARNPERHVVVCPDLWCSPCNLIRRPPRECRHPSPPECLRMISVDQVYAEAAHLLRKSASLTLTRLDS
ncbi:MAG: glycosyltransferase family 9 protein [Vicinamibacteria bacterium]|nr:glycosyltransferase family 9 protein [Vicinamibacteria bacterium]